MTGGLVQAGEAARSAGQPTQRSHPIKRMCEANHRRRQQYQPIQNSLGVADKVRPGWAKSQEGDAPWNRTAAGSGMGSARWAPPVSQTSQWSGRIVGLSRSQAPTPLESQCLPARRSCLDTQQLAPGKAEKLSRNRRVANATERRREPDVATRMFHRVSQVKPGVVTQRSARGVGAATACRRSDWFASDAPAPRQSAADSSLLECGSRTRERSSATRARTVGKPSWR
eukprot:TRINITY_DN3921_c0_g1_i3.p1 TRINITY_DN3921_c0_g1~~TRINITY_DN3921_c0_g1_i3.p1  ORF type:complete len:227 (+),score=1.19 TRINITY_DN3921_c0_g1_i3:216-896(+)